MGSLCEIQLYGESRIETKRIAKNMAAEVNRLERKYSLFRPDSFLSELNDSAGKEMGIKIDSETRGLFDHARGCFVRSEGLFDITAGVINRMWDFKERQVPKQSELNAALAQIGFDKLVWTRNRLYLPAGMAIDFGGIVKEYAADSLAKMARTQGCEFGLVNLGGDFTAIGPQPGGEPWPIGVAHPNDPDVMMAKIDLHEGGLASSGDYHRYFVHDGKRYSHIINPLTGWPCEGFRAVSVAANLCTVAGALSTIAMLKEEKQAQEWLLESGLPHVFMRQDETIDGARIRRDDVQGDDMPASEAEAL